MFRTHFEIFTDIIYIPIARTSFFSSFPISHAIGSHAYRVLSCPVLCCGSCAGMASVQRLPVSPQPGTTLIDPGRNTPESVFFINPTGAMDGTEGEVDGSHHGCPVESVVAKVLPGEKEAYLGREGGDVKSSAAGEGWGDIGECLAQSTSQGFPFIAGEQNLRWIVSHPISFSIDYVSSHLNYVLDHVQSHPIQVLDHVPSHPI